MTSAEAEDVVLSDVHIATDNSNTHIVAAGLLVSSTSNRVSRFYFKRKPKESKTETNSANIIPSDTDQHQRQVGGCCCDEDGDLIVTRRTYETIYIEHSLQTTLSNVGLQVWYGALLMCDFLLHCPEVLSGCIVVDLGSGVGLTSIVAALAAQHVYCTDYSATILQLAEKNIKRNSVLSENRHLPVSVSILDWFTMIDEHGLCAREALLKCNIILAADVVYDDDLTDAFFRTIYSVLNTREVTVYISLEKRYVFTLDDLDTVCTSYKHFSENLYDLGQLSTNLVTFHATQLDTDFPQYVQYDRPKHLELWRLTSTHHVT